MNDELCELIAQANPQNSKGLKYKCLLSLNEKNSGTAIHYNIISTALLLSRILMVHKIQTEFFANSRAHHKS